MGQFVLYPMLNLCRGITKMILGLSSPFLSELALVSCGQSMAPSKQQERQQLPWNTGGCLLPTHTIDSCSSVLSMGAGSSFQGFRLSYFPVLKGSEDFLPAKQLHTK